MKRILIFLLLITSLFMISCTTSQVKETSSINKDVQISGLISSIDRYGNITLTITTKDLLNKGFSYGDSVLLMADNGFMTTAVILTDYSVEKGSAIIKTGINSQQIIASINFGDLADEGTLILGNSITLSLLKNVGLNS